MLKSTRKPFCILTRVRIGAFYAETSAQSGVGIFHLYYTVNSGSGINNIFDEVCRKVIEVNHYDVNPPPQPAPTNPEPSTGCC